MNTDKIADSFLDMCLLKVTLEKEKNLITEEQQFLEWINNALGVIDNNLLSHYLVLCKSYVDVCKEKGLTPKLPHNKPPTVKDDGLSAGVGMASAGVFNGIATPEPEEAEPTVEEEVEDLDICLSEEEFGDLTAELDFA